MKYKEEKSEIESNILIIERPFASGHNNQHARHSSHATYTILMPVAMFFKMYDIVMGITNVRRFMTKFMA